MKYVEPEPFATSCTCPHCSVFSQFQWWQKGWDNKLYQQSNNNPIRVGLCVHCGQPTMFIGSKMYYPDSGGAPPPNEHMPDKVRALYYEAGQIHARSPRGAAALLRLGIQELMIELGEPGRNINQDIKNLVEKGLPKTVQQALDIVRVTGNDAVHPGQIDTDDQNIVANLFSLLNLIVEQMIETPKKVDDLYKSLPENKRQSIDQRDGN